MVDFTAFASRSWISCFVFNFSLKYYLYCGAALPLGRDHQRLLGEDGRGPCPISSASGACVNINLQYCMQHHISTFPSNEVHISLSSLELKGLTSPFDPHLHPRLFRVQNLLETSDLDHFDSQLHSTINKIYYCCEYATDTLNLRMFTVQLRLRTNYVQHSISTAAATLQQYR